MGWAQQGGCVATVSLPGAGGPILWPASPSFLTGAQGCGEAARPLKAQASGHPALFWGEGDGGASQPRFQGPGSRPQVLRGEQCGFSGAELGAGAGGHGALPLGLVLLLCLCGWSKVCSYRLRLDVLSLVQTDTGPSLRLLRALKRSRVPAGPHSLRAWTSGSLGA